MSAETRKQEFVVQYKVRTWWHDYYSYSTDDDAYRSIDHLPECIKERPVRVVERVTTDTILYER